MPAPVSLSESELEEDALDVIAESFTAPQWTDNSHEAALTNTLTANTSIVAVLDSLRTIVTITAAPAEAEIELTLRPQNFLRPRIVEVLPSSGDSAILRSIS